MDEKTLLGLVASGDEGAMDELSRRFGGLLRYVVSGVLHDAGEEDECVNDVLLRVWRAAGDFDPEIASAAAWLTAIARNTAITRLRAVRKRESAVSAAAPAEEAPSPSTPEAEVLKKERLERLMKAVNTLGALDRALFYRKYYYMQPVSRIAAETGLSERAAEGRLYRLRRRLRKELGGDAL